MADLKCLEEDAKSFAYSATTYDQQGHYQLACFYYKEAARALLEARQAGSEWPNIEAKADEYLGRAEVLKAEVISKPVSGVMKTAAELGVERAKFLVDQALDEDSAGNVEEAFKMYTEAADLCIQLRNETRDSLQTKVTKLAELALERAEALKSVIQPTPSAADRTSTQNAGTTGTVPGKKAESSIMSLGPLGLALKDDVESSYSKSKRVSPASGGGGGGGYTTEEINVLRITSSINNEKYVPFLDVDANEKFAFPVPFTDKHGMLALSPKQRDRFSKWVRPEQLCSDTPQVIYAVSSWTIRQTIVSDCSFVASLAIAAQYERRFNKKLITSIIYPQNRRREPQYNPCGKYMVKLNINGVPRKVIIDDFLPMGKDGNLLCSFSTNRNELWVSLLEKAYMKVMGGYDFPGSNSNIDLHALTGWIPERVAIHRSRTGSSDDQFNPEREFKRILDRFHQGHCLITVATGEMSESVAERAGLVPTHAYAMLDVRQIQGCQLFQLKNPWRHLRWRGNYSETDTTHWTESLKKALNYDPKLAEKDDDGVFWIDYKSIQEFFDVFYINWNPELFPFTTCYHHMWTEGPKKDSYSIGHNPQYRLEVKSTTASAVWILLTRHITNKDDFADNKEFITVLVYKTGGKRVYYPYDPPPYKDGIRINSPHYLCKMVTEPGTSLFTLVISQYERNKTIYYTLRTYGTCELKMTPVSMPYKHDKHINGEWKGRTAGGCSNHPETNVNNPMYQLKIDSKTADNQLLIELRGPKNFSVGFDIFTISEIIPNLPTSFAKKSAGDFRRGYVYLELENMSGGVYNVRPCTFNPNEESPFFLDFSCTSPISVTKVT